MSIAAAAGGVDWARPSFALASGRAHVSEAP
jgi:hypothetical protein